MADVHIIDSSESVNCARGIVLVGNRGCTKTWVPKQDECPLIVVSGWDTRWDDICYYSTCSGGV